MVQKLKTFIIASWVRLLTTYLDRDYNMAQLELNLGN